MSRLNLIFLALFIGLLIWITLFQPEAVGTIQRGMMVVMRPFTQAANHFDAAADQFSGPPLGGAALRAKLAEAERERDRWKLEATQLDEVVEENNRLRRALHYQERSPLSLVAARVISRKPSQWYSTLVVDKGSAQGLVPDCPVLTPHGEEAALVGKVSEVVGPNSAVVLLLTDEMCQVSAKLADSQEQGILSGQRGGLGTAAELRLRYLSKEAEVGLGTKVHSSGSGELFPPGLLLGEVTRVNLGVIDAEAAVKPVVDFDHLVDLFVVLPTADSEEPAPPESEVGSEAAPPPPGPR